MGKVEDAVATMTRNLESNTGRSLEAWAKLVRARKLGRHGEIVAWLKSEHELGHGYANLVASTSLKSGDAAQEDDLIGVQYSGAKAGLRPMYDAVIAAVAKFGKDVEVSPKKGYVSLRRTKQFAIVQPSTATRLDIGLNLKGLPVSERLEASGSFNTMVSHRVKLEAGARIDKELICWLKQAYDAA
jgi:predicted transport protein